MTKLNPGCGKTSLCLAILSMNNTSQGKIQLFGGRKNEDVKIPGKDVGMCLLFFKSSISFSEKLFINVLWPRYESVWWFRKDEDMLFTLYFLGSDLFSVLLRFHASNAISPFLYECLWNTQFLRNDTPSTKKHDRTTIDPIKSFGSRQDQG